VKFSGRQVLASVAGAVIAAVIASTFGVTGTIVGVAIGSAAATLATAFVAQSIERGQEAVKQVVVRAPDASPLLRRLGSTGSSGQSSSTAQGETVAGTGDVGDPTSDMESTGTLPARRDQTARLEVTAAAGAPPDEHLRATTLPPRQGVRRFSWRALAATAGVVFLLALGFITAIELISGQPLSGVFGGDNNGTTVKNIISPPPPSSSTTTSTTTSSSTTTTTAPATTTTTLAPGVSTTTAPSTTTTTTQPGGGSSSTTTTVAGATSP
jgi:hypothetical protein